MKAPFFTRAGASLDIASLSPDDIVWSDIATSLSKLCRWNGHCKGFYSVAQHCCMAHDWIRDHSRLPELCVYGLLHDAHEAFVGDIIYPVKQLLGPELQLLVNGIDSSIYRAARLEPPDELTRKFVKSVDRSLLVFEAGQLLEQTDPVLEWMDDFDIDEFGRIEPWSMKRAADEWTTRLFIADRARRQSE